MNTEIINKRISDWLNSTIVKEKDKQEIVRLKESNLPSLYEAFSCDLEFGTGGLRGIMGVGSNRMNTYTVGMATQGFANYIKEQNPSISPCIIIGYDCRHNSQYFAQTVAKIMSANDIEVLLFNEMRPTPQVSYLLRHFGCQAGVVCTASHNPKEYNGYKAYWNDGGQLVPPHDKKVIEHINAVGSFDNIKWDDPKKNKLIQKLGQEADRLYLDMVLGKAVHPNIIQQCNNISIVYTPIHGTGVTLLPQALQELGFQNVSLVKEQETPDGNFPTVIYPNPEEEEAMRLGLEKAKELNADLLIGTDPDADRIAIAVRDDSGRMRMLNGNQIAVLAFNYILEERATMQAGKIAPNDMVIKTIVSSPMLDKVASYYDCTCYNVLTGFKWVAALVREKETTENYLIGGEESFGLMWGSECRDKDGISASTLFCELAAVEKSRGESVFDKLIALYKKHGFYYESLIYITKSGIEGKKYIKQKMDTLRNSIKDRIANIPIVRMKDYLSSTSYDTKNKQSELIKLPKSNVLQFELEDGSLISARPSGTEPKIKFYISVNTAYDADASYNQNLENIQIRIDAIAKGLGI